MNSFVLIFMTVSLALFFGGILAFPLIRRSSDGYQFFISGARRDRNLQLRRAMLLENIRDLKVEQTQGKLSVAEFEQLAAPLAAQLKAVEDELRALGAKVTELRREPRKTRLGLICAVCGKLNRDGARAPAYCVQCGEVFPESK